ncbi:small subunit ribosomal protein S6 [Arcanobacterium wilhelmae]|uniref:Small ribosomal subunit protein bS6 n=1 Tax=Arcanobacterium wilhelmae TaxID=1803177 RepID=A0ABT9NAZ3_9ACTO|nr:30S ribosomal protein S6 [Arcanobacterium wilhelmae]MDP9800892.1 small subunit ribosomal protein S6 [Arcanobacterium wilhelmae]WFN90259.1 30S ribosomal protein S6 [Arcanobacterium wilhelmae]
MRQYEMMIILDPEVDERNLQSYLEKLLAVVPAEGGSVDKTDVMGRRRLAYDIKKKSEGVYVVVYMTAESATALELDRQLGLNESVLRTKLLRFEPKQAKN